MSDDQDRTKQEQHWQELADLLGLPPEPAPELAAPPAMAPKPTPVEPVEDRGAEPPARELRLAHEETLEPPASHPESGPEELPPPGVFAETELEPWETSSLSQNEEPEEEADVPRPSSRRRRGRRSGRGSRVAGVQELAESGPGDEEVETAQPSDKAETTSEAAEEDGSKRGRRGRGRKRHKKTPVLEERAEETPLEDEEDLDAESVDLEADLDESAEPEREDEELDDVDTLSDWNVPSWTELIESLYRPDR
jgi:hypothetical protein